MSPRCDRILFKSTVVPDPEEEIIDVAHRGTRGYRVGQFLANTFFYRSSRPRLDSSVSSISSGDSGHNIPKGSLSRRGTSSPQSPGHASGWDDSVHPPDPGNHAHANGMLTPHTAKPLPDIPSSTLVRIPTNPPPTEPKNDQPIRRRKRSFSVTTLPLSPFGLKVSPPEPPVITLSPSGLDSDSRVLSPTSAPQPMMSPITPSSPRRSTPPRRWFLPRVIIPSGVGLLSPEDRPANSSSPLPRRKGEIRCLSYNTLDDQAMARLRGKSDHRPIIGTYSICLE